MWSEQNGRPKLRATMPLKRFKTFLASARFDDKSTRTVRQQADKLAAITELFDAFVEKSNSLYNPSPFVCVDETLVGFRGRCSFRVYIPSKPARYGIKVWSLCDCGTNYVCNLQVYLGKEGESAEQRQGERVVKDLTLRLYGSGRNVTTDNFFTSYNLAQFLLTKQLTLLGTVRKNRREVPHELVPSSLSAPNTNRCLCSQRIQPWCHMRQEKIKQFCCYPPCTTSQKFTIPNRKSHLWCSTTMARKVLSMLSTRKLDITHVRVKHADGQ